MLSVEDARERYYKDSEGDMNKLDDYALLCFNIKKRIGKHASLFFRVENLLDKEFEIYEEGRAQAGFGRAFIGGGSVVF
jgi:outer membrane cobalamin receptor